MHNYFTRQCRITIELQNILTDNSASRSKCLNTEPLQPAGWKHDESMTYVTAAKTVVSAGKVMLSQQYDCMPLKN